MIIDNTQNAPLYFNLGERIAAALKFLMEEDVSQMEAGKHEIEGSDVFATVSIYETKSEEESSWEAHRQYIDIHAVLEGSERIARANIDKLNMVQAYDPVKDLIVLKGSGDMFVLEPGTFAICYPTDAHMPGVNADGVQQVKKMVIKVKAA